MVVPAAAETRKAVLEAARRLEAHSVYLFFKHGSRFCNPLVPAEWEALGDEPALDDEKVLCVAVDLLPSRLPALARGIYSPVPISHGLAQGRPLDSLLEDFRYEMIHVDDDQRWTWQGRPVAPRVKAFFLEHLGWEPAIQRWYFEYRVDASWWDKSYLEAEVTPLVALSLEAQTGPEPRVLLANGRRDRADLESLRLDCRERLFCTTARYGEVMFSDTARFSLLRHANQSCDALQLGERWVRLRWPECEQSRRELDPR